MLKWLRSDAQISYNTIIKIYENLFQKGYCNCAGNNYIKRPNKAENRTTNKEKPLSFYTYYNIY
jgi:DNA-binding transcriptional regulator YhcF (GntR family)